MSDNRCLCSHHPDQGGLPDTGKWDSGTVGLDSAGPSSVVDFLLVALSLQRKLHNTKSLAEHEHFDCFVADAVADDLRPLFA